MTLQLTTQAHRASSGVVEAASKELEVMMARLAGAPPDVVRDALLEALPVLADKWGDAAATVAAELYEAKRSMYLGTNYAASLADAPDAMRTERLARWAVGPLYDDVPDYALAVSQVVGGFQRLIADQGRATIVENVDRDTGATGWARHASANACTFCRLLATRGAVYKSRDAAATVGGRSSGGVRTRTRGKSPLGARYHDACRCIAVPVFGGETYEEAPYVKAWRDSYLDVGVTNSLSESLTNMRADMGAR